jgi:hypothetical protein
MEKTVVEKPNGMMVLITFDGVWVELTATRGGDVWDHRILLGDQSVYEATVRGEQRVPTPGYDSV